jgi:hypothetical protein
MNSKGKNKSEEPKQALPQSYMNAIEVSGSATNRGIM